MDDITRILESRELSKRMQQKPRNQPPRDVLSKIDNRLADMKLNKQLADMELENYA